MSLYLIHCQPDPLALASWATRQGLLSPDGDYGYALHALLVAAFGDHAPKPFCYLGARHGLLAYTDNSTELLRENASLATPDVAKALGLDSLATRLFPTVWQAGQRLGFEVRTRPVVRTKDGRERDVYLHALESASATETGSAPQREAVYIEWLSRQLQAEDAAQTVNVSVDGFRLVRVIRRAQDKETGTRKPRSTTGPDVLFRGELQVINGEAFAHLVARGVGRHRSFGFGMLLLKPVRSC